MKITVIQSKIEPKYLPPIGWKAYVKMGTPRVHPSAYRVLAELQAKNIATGTRDTELEQYLTDEWEVVRVAARDRLIVLGKFNAKTI